MLRKAWAVKILIFLLIIAQEKLKKLMKTTKLFTIALVLIGFISCSKTGTKALERGDYYNAAIQAIEKLKKDTDNEKSQAVLPNAYELASEDLLKSISRSKNANQQFRWESVFQNYSKLNSLHDAISKCMPCRKLISPQSYFKEAEEARENAANERYALGQNLLRKNTIEAGREAFTQFEKLLSFAPNFKDAREKLDEALFRGSLHVVIEQPKVNSRLYQYSNEYMQNKVSEYLQNNRRMNKFIRFYEPKEVSEIKLNPDHVVRLEFIDFVVGETSLTRDRFEVVSKDSVKTGSTVIEGKTYEVKGKVKAQIVKNRKVVNSRGLMLLEVFDFKTNRRLFRDELPGEYTWVNEWATYNGDERALNNELINMTNRREELPPAPQQLFVEFCRPIYDQFTSRITNFYKKY